MFLVLHLVEPYNDETAGHTEVNNTMLNQPQYTVMTCNFLLKLPYFKGILNLIYY